MLKEKLSTKMSECVPQLCIRVMPLQTKLSIVFYAALRTVKMQICEYTRKYITYISTEYNEKVQWSTSFCFVIVLNRLL